MFDAVQSVFLLRSMCSYKCSYKWLQKLNAPLTSLLGQTEWSFGPVGGLALLPCVRVFGGALVPVCVYLPKVYHAVLHNPAGLLYLISNKK